MMVHCGDELLGTEEINTDVDKIIGYESPITRICENISRQLVEQEEEIYMHTISQAVGYAVDKEELVKALQYDRNQYEKGYKDGVIEVLDKIRADIIKQSAKVPTLQNEYLNGLKTAYAHTLAIIDKYKSESKG